MGPRYCLLALAHSLEMVGEGHRSPAVEDNFAMGILGEGIGSMEVAGIPLSNREWVANGGWKAVCLRGGGGAP